MLSGERWEGKEQEGGKDGRVMRWEGGKCGIQSSERYLQDVLKIFYQDKQDFLPRHRADVQKMS